MSCAPWERWELTERQLHGLTAHAHGLGGPALPCLGTAHHLHPEKVWAQAWAAPMAKGAWLGPELGSAGCRRAPGLVWGLNSCRMEVPQLPQAAWSSI